MTALAAFVCSINFAVGGNLMAKYLNQGGVGNLVLGLMNLGCGALLLAAIIA